MSKSLEDYEIEHERHRETVSLLEQIRDRLPEKRGRIILDNECSLCHNITKLPQETEYIIKFKDNYHLYGVTIKAYDMELGDGFVLFKNKCEKIKYRTEFIYYIKNDDANEIIFISPRIEVIK